MADAIQQVKVICEGGLTTNENYLETSSTKPGWATRLVNFETSLWGGYRRINGFRDLDATYDTVASATTEGKVFGVFGFRNESTNADEIMAARKKTSGNTYGIYEYEAGIGWTEYVTGVTQSSVGVNRLRFSLLNNGTDNHVTIVDGVNKALVYNGASWYQLDSANTGGTSSPGGNQCINTPKFTTVFKNYLFLAQDGLVAHSAPFDPLEWDTASGGGQIPVGFTIVQIYPWRDELYVFGLNQIKKIVMDSAGDFVLQDVTSNIGCLASDSVQEVASNLVFLAPDGIRPVAGTEKTGDVELSMISEEIQSLIQQYNESNNPDDITSVVVKQKTQVRYFFSNGATAVANSKGLIGCFSALRGKKWEFGELYGIRASCCWSGYLSGVEYVLHGDHNGKVYRQESGSDFDDADIVAVYTTPFYDFGNTTIRKAMHKLHTFFRCEGDLELNISVRYDWRRSNTINPVNYQEIPSEGGAEYGGSGVVYGTNSVYGSPSQPIATTNIQGSGHSVQFSYVATGTWSPFTIQGFVIEFNPEGRQ